MDLDHGLQRRKIMFDKTNFNIIDRPIIIAEIGMNHNGSIINAEKLIRGAKYAGADCVKFQLRDLKSLYSDDALHFRNADLGVEYQINLLKKFELSPKDLKKLKIYSDSLNMSFICTPWDIKSADILENIGVSAYKIASADLTNMELINHVIKKKKFIIISTGMSTEQEINYTVKFLKTKKAKFMLLHCNSTYPTPIEHLNINYIDRLKRHKVPVGYSGHERGFLPTLAAVSKNIALVERHITLDKTMEGPDHLASLDIEEFKKLVSDIRIVSASLGNNNSRVVTQGELINRENLSKSIYTKKHIKKGQTFNKSHLEIKSPGQGLNPQKIDLLIGKRAKIDIKPNCMIMPNHYRQVKQPKNKYNFKKLWAIPVRYHDLDLLYNKANPPMVEFHLSFNDLDKNLNKYLDKEYECEFIVHAPELFANDHLLDLCTDDQKYREHSIENILKVIKVTKSLQKYFPHTTKPKIILNCGGFSQNSFLDKKERDRLYRNLKKSLKQISDNNIQFIPQNMAPFPWHFGGQRYQNLFMDTDEIVSFCTDMNMKICHDISHSFLACNYHNWDYYKYTKKLIPYTAHYHIADASDVHGEGLQLGKGAVNFKKVLPLIKNSLENVSFIPEIWQGHKNEGEQFWKALHLLENKI